MTKFVAGCIEKDISRDVAMDMWQKFEYFSGYGFNKSHAVATQLYPIRLLGWLHITMLNGLVPSWIKNLSLVKRRRLTLLSLGAILSSR